LTQPPEEPALEVVAPSPTTDERSTDLRARVLAEATRLFARRGYAATSMREVAEGARCTKPALYYYFQSKGALFLEVIREQNGRVREIIERHLSGSGDVRERIRRAMHAYFQHVREDPDSLAVQLRAEIHREADQPEYDFRSSRQLIFDLVLRLLREGVDHGEISGEIELEDALFALGGMVDMRCMLWLLDHEPIPDDYPERVLALMFRGLAP
jgi:AcrR family transcriptional regulator